MADNNQNQRGSNRNSNQDRNEHRNRSGRYEEDDRNESSDYRGSRNSGQGTDEGQASWQSRYQREENNRSGDRYNSSRYGRNDEHETHSGNSGNRDFGYTPYSGDSYRSGNSNRGSRELYDRDYEGANRSDYSNSGTRLGAGNYGNSGDRGQTNERVEGYRNYGGNSGSNYGSNFNSGSAGRSNDDRNWWNRTTDEVSSWFGDDEAERRRNRDKQLSGEHKGKGPKNYSRSDDRIKDDVNDRLSDDPFIDATEIEVSVSSGEVTLTGTVDHRSTKRRAEDLAESVSGVKNVENRIRVGQNSGNRNSEKETDTTGNGSQSTSTSAVAGSERSRTKSNYVTG